MMGFSARNNRYSEAGVSTPHWTAAPLRGVGRVWVDLGRGGPVMGPVIGAVIGLVVPWVGVHRSTPLSSRPRPA